MADYVEAELLKKLSEWADEVDAQGTQSTKMLAKTKTATNKAAALEKQSAKLDARLDQLTLKLVDGTVPQETYTRLRDDITAQKKQVELDLAAAKVAVAKPPAELLPELIADWPLIQVDMRRDILSRLIKYVEVFPGRPRAKIVVHPLW
jgi:site-specific DNA recombinase